MTAPQTPDDVPQDGEPTPGGEAARPTPAWPVRDITDPRELRALAHPLRFALIDLLAEGPLTASQCAEKLGESPASCSYHLRQLARYGHVEPAGGGHGRERPWKSRDGGIRWDESTAAGRSAGRLLAQTVDEFRFDSWRRYRDNDAAEPAEWRDAALSTDMLAWLTPDELRDVTQRIYDIFGEYEHREDDATARPDAARLVRFFAYAYAGFAGRRAEERGE
ncbi:Helix-turn-helix domain-containing protein [Paraoerskovia marina]|uniref:Helix-turn-helix domain-containing protein n=1 Tax=Paraoerskovia marina TaxID=545619 RepID=A0A1H1M6Q0_9CELL|nr:winged helix-turn-helix domain-containing protein [Paraoerskovia marina]SDR82514.1 Helix-turn-helix domain-containing protein [Paraoerskovia marina]